MTLDGLAKVLVKMATVEQAEWIVSKLDGNIPHTLETAVDVTFMPTGGQIGAIEKAVNIIAIAHMLTTPFC